jgi:hypothetical protein
MGRVYENKWENKQTSVQKRKKVEEMKTIRIKGCPTNIKTANKK